MASSRTLINGTGYDIKSGRTLINGTGYDIKKGRTLINGTGYDIKFNTPLGEIPEGTVITIKESGSPVEFYVAQHNYRSDLNGAGRTLLVRKTSAGSMAFDASYGAFEYYRSDMEKSDIKRWLNNTYYGRFSDYVKTAMDTTKFKFITSISSSSDVDDTVLLCQCAAFLLGISEIGLTLANYTAAEGEALPIAGTLITALGSSWTRSSSGGGTAQVCRVGSTTISYDCTTSTTVHPVFTLPEIMEVDSDFNLIEAEPRTITLTNLVADEGRGWISWAGASNCTRQSSSATPGDGATGSCRIVPSAAGECTITFTKKTPALVSSHKYYVSFKVKYESAANCSFDFYWPIAEPVAAHLTVNAEADVWTRTSAIFTREAFTDGSYQCRFDYNNEAENIPVRYASLMLFDLTEAFGAGFEPSKEWLDEHITTFGDSLSLTYI